MTEKVSPTIQKLVALEDEKKARVAQLIEELGRQHKALLAKRKDEIFKLFCDNDAVTMDDQLLIGFLKFASNKENKDSPTLKEFKALGATHNNKKPRQPKGSK